MSTDSKRPGERTAGRKPGATTSAARDKSTGRPSGGGRSAAQKRQAGQRALAAASGAQRARRKRALQVIVPIVVVLAIVAVFGIVKAVGGGSSSKAGNAATIASSKVIDEVTHVPASVYDAVDAGTFSTPMTSISGPALLANGKPAVFYDGAEYCPYCATERWAVVAALARFGTFSDLGQTASSPTDVYPNTATLSFHGSSFTSSVLAFNGKESQGATEGTPLDTLTSSEQTLVTKDDKGGGIPFVDIGGRYVISGASYDPAVLQGKTHAQIAAALSDPSSPIAKGAIGTANVITAAVCASTGDKPTSVCTSPGVVAGKAKLPGASS